MKPYYEHAGITIYHGDCLEIAPQINGITAIISDPPYGMNWDTDSQKRYTRKIKGAGRAAPRVIGDDTPFNPSPWLKYKKVILWGYQHFANKLPTGTILVWIKKNDESFGTFLSDADTAWFNNGHGVYCFRDLGLYKIRSMGSKDSDHPTVKPLSLMKWCIDKARLDKDDLILDPYIGSGTTLRAAKDLGRKAIGIEIEERYCEIAAKRLAQEVLFGAI